MLLPLDSWLGEAVAVDPSQFTQYGAFGIGALAASLLAWKLIQDMIRQRDAAQTESREQRVAYQKDLSEMRAEYQTLFFEQQERLVRAYQAMQDKIVPSLQDSTRSVEEATNVVRTILREDELARVRQDAIDSSAQRKQRE